MPNITEILACPECKNKLIFGSKGFECKKCFKKYAVKGRTPIMLNNYKEEKQPPLETRDKYTDWIFSNIIESLDKNHVILDVGNNNMELDIPNVMRMDILYTPYVDIVGDIHNLPFLDDSVDYIFSNAVLEHLRDPVLAAKEMYRVCKPGGYIYADTNFVFTYHGFPHHYFNFSLTGLEEVLKKFKRIKSGVPPYQMPSYAISDVLGHYLKYFNAESWRERVFVRRLKGILKYPLKRYDTRFKPDVVHRISAGVFFYGIKYERDKTIIPQPIMKVYYESKHLQKMFSNPYDLSNLPNLMSWAKNEGRKNACIENYYKNIDSFDKYVCNSEIKKEFD